MNLICITESELAQWVSRRYLDALASRVLVDREKLTPDIFFTAPYLKLEDGRGRIIVHLKSNWLASSSRWSTDGDVNAVSIPIDAIVEIVPAMDQYAKRLGSYRLPVAQWSAEKVWNDWLFRQGVAEIRRAIALELGKIGFLQKGMLDQDDLMNAIIQKSIRPHAAICDEAVLLGWSGVLEHRDVWLQELRSNGLLDSTEMLRASAELISNTLDNQVEKFQFQLADYQRGWTIQDLEKAILEQFSVYDQAKLKEATSMRPPIFCIAAYLRAFDEIHYGSKDWRTIFDILRLTKYSVNSLHADLMMVSLISSLRVEEIYAFGLNDLYHS